MNAVDPPRSRFFSLSPIGVGSPQVESLDGYVCRLAAKHRVRPSVLRIHLGNEPDRFGRGNAAPWPGLLERTAWACGDKAARLADLTLKPDVARLGLGNLSCHVSPNNLLASQNSWCPQCLREMLSAGTFYVPQAWRLHCYTHCTRHGQRMRTQCTHCHRSTSSLDMWFQSMGICHWCNRSLLTGADMLEVSTWTDEVISGELETLFAALSGDFSDQRHSRIEPLCSWLLREGRQRSTNASPESMARISG